MNRFDAAHVAGPLSELRSRLDIDEPGALHTAITSGPDLLVQHARPIVADLVGSGRMGLGTLLAPSDPMVIMDGVGYRLDAGVSVCRVSPLERVRRATVVELSPRQPLSPRVPRTPRQRRAPRGSGLWVTAPDCGGGAVGHLQRRDCSERVFWPRRRQRSRIRDAHLAGTGLALELPHG